MKALFKRAQKRAKTLGRIGVAVAVLASPLAFAAPASAGTLTTPTWTVMDPRTNIQGNRYDYGFTTATTGTVSRVTATVPAGTSGSNRYVATNGNFASYIDTPDAPVNDITGNIDVRMKLTPKTWTAAPYQRVISKWGAGNRSWTMNVTGTGLLSWGWSTTGSDQTFANSTLAVPFTGNSTGWIRSTFTPDNGASGNTTTFYTSTDGINWTVLGTPVVQAGTTTLYSPSGGSSIRIGVDSASSGPTAANFYYADVRNGINGTTTSPSNCSAVAVCFDASNAGVAGTSWKAADAATETWTLSRSAVLPYTDIVSNLSVMNISGLLSGGTAQLREIDGVANYILPTPTSIPAATAIKLGLAGMTNTYTAGSYTSTLTTLDSSSATIDSAATGSVAFTVPTIGTYSATPTILQSATAATSVDTYTSNINVIGSKLYYADVYSNTVNYVDTGTNMTTRVAGLGYRGSGNGAALTASTFYAGRGVVQDSAGNIYVLDQTGNWIRKITSGAVSTLISSGFSAGRSLTIDSSDNMYIADSSAHVIRKMTTSGTLTTVVGTGTNGSAVNATSPTGTALNSPFDVAVTSDGSTLYVADTSNNRILQVVLGTGATSVFAGGGASFADGGSATATTLNGPKGVAVDASGNVYISDTGNNRVRKVSGGVITTIAGNGTAGYSGDGGTATSATMNVPQSVQVDSSGNVYFSDYNNFRVRKVSGTTITTFAGTGSASWNGDGGNVSKAHFNSPGGMHADSSGNILVADTGNNAVRKIDQFGNVSTIAGLGPTVGGDTGDGATATAAGVYGPRDVIADNAGNIYISQPTSGRLRKINSSGVISTLATGASFYDLAFSPDFSTLYSTGACVVYSVNPSTGAKTTFAGNGTCNSPTSGDGGAATSAGFYNTRGLTVDPAGNVYVSDYNNLNVRRVDVNGIISNFASGASNVDGTGNLTRQTNASDFLAGDAIGNIYTIRSGLGARVVRLGANGTSATVAGNGATGYAADGTAATGATLVLPGGATVSLGGLYVADQWANTIRVVAQQAAVSPLVNADSMSVPMNTPRSWPILSNDWSRSNEMDPSSVTITSQPINGTVTLTVPLTEATTLQANYTPTTSYTGSDSFTYRACDSTRVLCGTATVSITVTSNGYTTVAGGVTEGKATSISMSPANVIRLGNYLFFTDAGQNVVRRFDNYSGQVTTVVGTGISGFTSDSVPATSSQLQAPRGLAIAPDGTLVIADVNNSRVRQVSPNGTISTIAGTGVASTTGDGAAATAATLSFPSDVSYALDGSVYASSSGRIRRIVIGGNITTVAGTGTLGNTGDNGAATSAQIYTPRVTVFAPNGDWYFTDYGTNVIRKVTAGGIISTVAGTGTASFTGDGAAATSATMNSPRGLSIDSSGNLYVVDSANNRVRKITASTGFISTIAGGGASYVDGGSSTSTSLNGPTSIVFGANGDYWVTDTSNFRIRYVNTSSVISNIIGFGYSVYAGDGGPALQTQLLLTDADTSMTADSSGNLYISEPASHRIRRVDATTGVVTGAIGTGTLGRSATYINFPRQLTTDSSGNVYFAESGNCDVRD